MSVISHPEIDYSNALCKRFAALTSTYLADPVQAKSAAAKVPLENVYRILEMYRYEAFADESRGGVLAMGDIAGGAAMSSSDLWHTEIEEALKVAMADAYGATPKTQAIQDLQDTLRDLAGGNIDVADPQHRIEKAQRFFTKFVQQMK